jgi:hypothetical protein
VKDLSARLRSDVGSIPMVMLVAIIVAGLSSVLVARVTGEIRAVQFDENYTVAAHVADAGIQDALFRLNNQLITASSTCAPPTGDGSTTGVACGSGTVDGETYQWLAAYDGDAREWEVESTGSRADRVGRTLTAFIAERPLFGYAAFSERGMTFTGGNSADSYNSVENEDCSLGLSANADCLGILASNDDVRIMGNNEIDQVHIYNWEERPDGGGVTRCDASGNSAPFCQPPHRSNFDERFEIEATVTAVEEEIAACTTWHSWTASSEGSGTVTFPFDGGKHCFDTLTIDRDTVLRSNVTANNPLRIYMRDDSRLQVHTGKRFNIQNCTGANTNRPCSVRLQVYSLATDGASTEAVRIQNHAKVAMGLFVPRGSCGVLSGSNAQVDFYGSMVCKEIRNEGGWGFHYDEALAGAAGDGVFVMSRLDER